MAEYTPGPWRASPAKPDGSCFRADVVTRSRKSGLDIMPAQAAGYTANEAAANAQLIAAAPDLLEALKNLVPPDADCVRSSHGEEYSHHPPRPEECEVCAGRAAIALAKP
jgi:hypothetical protein